MVDQRCATRGESEKFPGWAAGGGISFQRRKGKMNSNGLAGTEHGHPASSYAENKCLSPSDLFPASPNSYFQKRVRFLYWLQSAMTLVFAWECLGGSGFWGISEVPWMYPFRGGGGSGSLETGLL